MSAIPVQQPSPGAITGSVPPTNSPGESSTSAIEHAGHLWKRLFGWTAAYEDLSQSDDREFLSDIENYHNGIYPISNLPHLMQSRMIDLENDVNSLISLISDRDEFNYLSVDFCLSRIGFSAFFIGIGRRLFFVQQGLLIASVIFDLYVTFSSDDKSVIPGQLSPDFLVLFMVKSFIFSQTQSSLQNFLYMYEQIICRLPNQITLLISIKRRSFYGSRTYYATNIAFGLLTSLFKAFSEPVLRMLQTRQVNRALRRTNKEENMPRIEDLSSRILEHIHHLNKYREAIDEKRSEYVLSRALAHYLTITMDRAVNLIDKAALLVGSSSVNIDRNHRKKAGVFLAGCFVSAVWNGFSARSPALLSGSIRGTLIMMSSLVLGLRGRGFDLAEMERIVSQKTYPILVTTIVVGAQLWAGAKFPGSRRVFHNRLRLIITTTVTAGGELAFRNLFQRALARIGSRLFDAFEHMGCCACLHRTTAKTVGGHMTGGTPDQFRALEEVSERTV